MTLSGLSRPPIDARPSQIAAALLALVGRQNVVGQSFDLPLGQTRRMRIRRDLLAELSRGEAIALLGLVSVFVKMRHLRSGPSASDHLDQLLAIELGRVQVRRLSRRARIATPVAIDAMAELTVRLLVIQAIAKGAVLGADRACCWSERDDSQEQQIVHALVRIFLKRRAGAGGTRSPECRPLRARTRTAWFGCAALSARA